jgi:signal recognition particle subunit SRP54
MRENKFDLNDFLGQLQQIKKMGNIKDVMGMIPGMSSAIKDVDISNDSFKPIESIIQSMTPKEREKPELIDANRKKRIAGGAGRTIQEVNNLLKQFEQMKKMMKRFNNMGPGSKMKMFG